MMIDEAIQHCLEVAEQLEEKAKTLTFPHLPTEKKKCRECAADHRQVAEWLMDLKKLSLQIAEYKHGYWAEEEPRVLKCSVCGEYAPMNYLGQNCIDSRYCPWCGTKMDSNADEPWQSE